MNRDYHPQSPPPHIHPDPQQRSPPPGSPNTAPTERGSTFLEPSLNYLSKFPENGLSHPRFPNGAPTERDTRFQSLPQKFIFPSKFAVLESPPCFPNRVPMERDAPSPEPMIYSFIYICWSPHLRIWQTGMNNPLLYATIALSSTYI
jgi:hypothetical protein